MQEAAVIRTNQVLKLPLQVKTPINVVTEGVSLVQAKTHNFPSCSLQLVYLDSSEKPR